MSNKAHIEQLQALSNGVDAQRLCIFGIKQVSKLKVIYMLSGLRA